jgi:hypothetical protein
MACQEETMRLDIKHLICQDQPRCAGLRIFIAWNTFPCAPGKGKFCSRISNWKTDADMQEAA